MTEQVAKRGDSVVRLEPRDAPTDDTVRARLDRQRHPGYSWCLRCGFTWATVKGHSTWYSDNKAMFPLCEDCWEGLAHPEARIGYYATLVEAWEAMGCPVTAEERHGITRAVAAGH